MLAAGAAGLIYAGRQALRSQRRLGFAGKIVLITGGSRGLGLAIAKAFAREGARLAICARTEEQVNAAWQELGALGAEVLPRVVDVTKADEVTAFVREVREKWGQIDVLVDNAGIISAAPYNAAEAKDYEASLSTHFWASYHTVRAAVPHMRRRGAGRIVNVASIGGVVALPGMSAYAVGKFALVGFSQALRAELAQEGIYVTTVCPGLIVSGSQVNVEVKGGAAEALYDRFKRLNAWLGIPVEQAAWQIVEAARYGQAVLTFPGWARAMAGLQGLAPGLMAGGMALANRFVPEAQPGAFERKTGQDLETPADTEAERRLYQAAVANNQQAPISPV